MKIIVLGMDNTGKTTLVNRLSEYMNYKVVPSLGKSASKEEIESYLITNLQSPENCIFERFSFFEELVYGYILRGKSKFNFNDRLFKVLRKEKPIIIYCRPRTETIMNFGTREQMNGVIKNAYKLLDEFDALMREVSSVFEVYRYDYENEDYKHLWNRIMNN